MKNTTMVSIGEFLCPHRCLNCGRVGSLFCLCCRKYLLDFNENGLINDVVLKKHKVNGVFLVGRRDGGLKKLIEVYKYNSARLAADIFAYMLSERIVRDWAKCDNFGVRKLVIVALPTSRSHVRVRGFDHMQLIAKKLCKKMQSQKEKFGFKKIECGKILIRNKNTVQVGADAEKRKRQAQEAYAVAKNTVFAQDAMYLLLDDVWTTGASMLAAVDLITKNGANKVSIAIIAKSD